MGRLLSFRDAQNIRDLYDANRRHGIQVQLAERYGVSVSVISDIIHRRTYQRPRGYIDATGHAGMNNPNNRLTDQDRADILTLCSLGLYTYAAIGSQFGVSKTTVYRIAKKGTIIAPREEGRSE